MSVGASDDDSIDPPQTYRDDGRTRTCDFDLSRPPLLSRELKPEPNGDVVVVVPPLLRLIVPDPKRDVVVVVPSDDRLMLPDPKGLVVTVCPSGPRVIAPLPNLLVVKF